MTPPTLVVCGTLTLDTTERGGVTRAEVPGGSALYASAAASAVSSSVLPVRMLGTIGSDFPRQLLDQLTARGVDTTAVERLDGPTFRWHARYGADGAHRETISRDRGVAEGRMPPIPPAPDGAHGVLLASTSPLVQSEVRAQHPRAVLTALDSMAHWWTTHAALLQALLARVDVLFTDPEELTLASDVTQETAAVAALQARGPGVVVVKRGADGATLYRRGEPPRHHPADRSGRVVDTTGAGDALAGALVAALLSGARDEDALGVAVRVAARAIGTVGTAGLLEAP